MECSQQLGGDDHRVDQGGVVLQEQDARPAALDNFLQAHRANAVAEPQHRTDEPGQETVTERRLLSKRGGNFVMPECSPNHGTRPFSCIRWLRSAILVIRECLKPK